MMKKKKNYYKTSLMISTTILSISHFNSKTESDKVSLFEILSFSLEIYCIYIWHLWYFPAPLMGQILAPETEATLKFMFVICVFSFHIIPCQLQY